MTGDLMIAVRRGEADFDPKLAALLNLAREYTAKIGNTTDASGRQAIDAGWIDEQLAELSIHVKLNLLTNYFNHHVHTELEGQSGPGAVTHGAMLGPN